jgi:Tol biopolymer transport system component
MSAFTRNVTLILILLGILGFFACEERTTPPQEPKEEGLPPLEDGIPFDKLGSGKLVFHRQSETGNKYYGVYVIDINERKSWGIFRGPSILMVSPDGSRIAFSKLAGDTLFDIHVMNIDGSNIQNISHIEGQDRLPTWTPDNNEVLFSTGVSEILYRQSPIPNPPDRKVIRDFSGEGSIGSPVFVSKSLKLVFLFSPFHPGVRNIYTMDIDGTSLEPISKEIPEGFRCFSPCWSPDGQKIAYLLIGDWLDGRYTSLEVMVMDFDGNNSRSLTKLETSSLGWGLLHQYNELSICWSPDGSKLVFNKFVESYHLSHLYLINIDGTGLSQVTFAEGVADWSVSWSY